MIKEFDLGCFRRCRIIFDFIAASDLCKKSDAEPSDRSASHSLPPRKSFSVFIEASLPKGGMIVYGGLGAKFYFSESNVPLKIEYRLPSLSREVYGGSLISAHDTAYIGLPNEYLFSVREGVDHALSEKMDTMTGAMIMDQAVYSDVGSNNHIFRLLSYWIFSSFGDEGKIFNEDMLTTFFAASSSTRWPRYL